MNSLVEHAVASSTGREKESHSKDKTVTKLKFHKKMVGYLKHYCNHTTLHGFSYLVDPDLSFTARCFWFVVMTTSCCLMIVTVNNQIYNFINNPIVMAHNGKTLKMNDIPFPAMSFCSDNQIKPSDMNFTRLFTKRGNYTATEKHFLSVALSLCYINKDRINYEEIRSKSDINSFVLLVALFKDCKANIRELKWHDKDLKDPCKYLNASITVDGGCYSFNQALSKDCRANIRELKWHDKDLKDPCKYLNASITIDGGCYSFNQVHAYTEKYFDSFHKRFKNRWYRKNWVTQNPGSIWNPEDGYTTNRTDLFPWRMRGGSLSRTVRFILDLDANDMQDFCTLGGRGFLVKGYNPAEQPTLAGGIAYAQVDRMTIIEVVPELITTSDNLKSWPPQKRGCYYNNERSLQLYTLYTYNNCEMECIANITMDRCNCTAFFLPHLSSQRNCGMYNEEDMECIKRLYYSGSTNTSDDLRMQYSDCNCLPSCVELKYNFKVNDMPWNFSSLETKFKKKSSFVGLHITYKGGSVNVIERDCVYTFSSLIASIGGVMGLFLGFSTISFFEIIYYTIIKWLKLIILSGRGDRRVRPVANFK